MKSKENTSFSVDNLNPKDLKPKKLFLFDYFGFIYLYQVASGKHFDNYLDILIKNIEKSNVRNISSCNQK